MLNNRRFARSIVLASCLSLPLLAGGCLVTSHSDQSRSGSYVADSTLAQIQPGKTSQSWVRATIGQPTKIDRLEDGTELWKYSYTERKDSSGAVFLIFGGSDVKETTGNVFIELKNGVVTKTWRG